MATSVRKKAAPRAPAGADAERRLAEFIDKFEPDVRAVIRAARKAMRRRFPTAYEMVYDNYNFFVIGYSPTDKPSEALVSIAAAANGVGICFIRGATLPDPQGLLLGGGKQTRFLRLDAPGVLARPEVEALLQAAVAQSPRPFRERGKLELVIRSVSAKQRPRRRAETESGSASRARERTRKRTVVSPR